MMARYLLIALSAFSLAVTVTPVVRRLAMRIGFVDQPSARKVHTLPIPLLGGVAIYASFILTLVLLGDRGYVRETIGIMLGATLCSFMGFWDDHLSLSAYLKLGLQLLAAAILVVSGVQVRVLPYESLNIAVTVVWVVGITNAMNLLDNMNGLSSGIAATASAFLVLLAAMSGQYLVGTLAAALLGACVGFLVHNLRPAGIFMGDTGSLFIGFLLAAVGVKLRFPDNVHFVTWMIPIAVLAIPIFDTSLVFYTRLRRGVNPLTTPGRDHASHRLVALGYNNREAVLILQLAACGMGVVAMYLTQATVVEGYTFGAAVCAIALFFWVKLSRVDTEAPAPTADGPATEPTNSPEASRRLPPAT